MLASLRHLKERVLPSNKGFSILEIMIFVTLLSVILVAAVGYTIRVVQFTLINQHKLLANHYVQETKEWLDGERAVDWQVFQSKASTTGITYCLNNELTLAANVSGLTSGACTDYNGVAGIDPLIYKREVSLRKNSSGTASQVTAIITVKWMEGDVEYIDTLEQVYTIWE